MSRFGRKFAEDKRDKKFQLPKLESSKCYNYWYDTYYFGNQGARPHCVGYAWTHFLCNSPMTNYIDPDGLYELAQHFDEWKGTNYAGTSVRAGAKILKKIGLIDRYEWTWDLETLINTVLERSPVVVGTHWYAGMDRPDEDGVIQAKGRSLGGHAYLVNGCSRDRGMVRIKNSWGRKWADDGRAWIPFEDMEKLIKAEGEVCLAVERLAKPPERSRPSIQIPIPREEPAGSKAKPRRKRGAPAIKRPRKRLQE